MKKVLFALILLSEMVWSTAFICEGDDTLMIIETDGDYAIKVNINGQKHHGIWKGSTVDDKGKPVKLHALYGKDNIWIHSQDRFTTTTIRFYSDLDNMYLREVKCRVP